MDINVQTEILKRSSLFKNLPDYTIRNIAENTKIITFPQDTILFNEGDNGDLLYIIGSGSVTLYKNTATSKEVPVYKHQTGDYFGEIALLNETGKRTVTAKAEAKSLLFGIPGEVLMVLLQQNGTLAINLLKNVSARLDATYDQLARQDANSALPITDLDLALTDETTALPTDINEMFYDRKLECPHCGTKFTTPRVLTKHITIEKSDDDFCNYYKGLNPIYYDVAVCPQCSFAFTDETREPLGANAATGVKRVVDSLPKKDYCKIRNASQAKETFVLAIKSQTAAGSKQSLIAKLYLRLAWLHRYEGDTVNEYKFIEQAIKHYEIAFSRENFNPKQEIMLLYLVGELYARIGDPKMAINWFNRVVTHPQKQVFIGIVNRARDRWQDIRAEMKNAEG
ncbi:DUF2225 domain-containing protein [Peptococcaceae bacterium 1198_IL3148]